MYKATTEGAPCKTQLIEIEAGSPGMIWHTERFQTARCRCRASPEILRRSALLVEFESIIHLVSLVNASVTAATCTSQFNDICSKEIMNLATLHPSIGLAPRIRPSITAWVLSAVLCSCQKAHIIRLYDK